MAKVYAMIADGTEEVECLAVVDLLRRSKIDTVLVAAKEDREVVTSHGIRIQADAAVGEVDFSDADVIFLPGGMPGTLHLGEHQYLAELLKKADQEKKGIAAICAAPSVLGDLGLLRSRKATCYPGFEERLTGASISTDPVVTDGHITTSRGMGTAIPFALELVTRMCGKEKSDTLSKSIIYNI